MNADALFQEAQQYQGNLRKQLLERVCSMDKNHNRALFELALIHVEEGQTGQAKKLLKHVLVLDNANTSALVLLADLYQALQKKSKADALFKKACDTIPRPQAGSGVNNANNMLNAKIYALLKCAIIYEDEKQLVQAEQCLVKAKDLSDQPPTRSTFHGDIMFNLARHLHLYHTEKERIHKAQIFYSQALELLPKNVSLMLYFARFLQDVMGNLEKAEDLYKKACSLQQEASIVYAQFLKYKKNQPSKADEMLKRVTRSCTKCKLKLNEQDLFCGLCGSAVKLTWKK